MRRAQGIPARAAIDAARDQGIAVDDDPQCIGPPVSNGAETAIGLRDLRELAKQVRL